MIPPERVAIWYLIGNDCDGHLEKTSGILLGENDHLFVVAEIKKKVLVGKRSIIKMEYLDQYKVLNLKKLGI